jgi:TM2 domain-containing membrane protein YozV
MIRKKSKFLTFIFSAMFGAGQMYMGFMKQGISIMSVAVFIIAIGSLLQSSILILILPILWFYSFFDSMNKASLPDELFQTVEDHYLFLPVKESPELTSILKKYNNLIAAGLIIVGGFVLLDELMDYIAALLTDTDYTQLLYFINEIRWNGARLLLSIVIIIIGVKLIIGKKNELEKEETILKETIKKETRQKETRQKETRQKETMQKEAMQKEAIQKETMQEESMKKSMKEEIMNQVVSFNSNPQTFSHIAEITMKEKEADERA